MGWAISAFERRGGASRTLADAPGSRRWPRRRHGVQARRQSLDNQIIDRESRKVLDELKEHA
jgi:hypothetical protein